MLLYLTSKEIRVLLQYKEGFHYNRSYKNINIYMEYLKGHNTGFVQKSNNFYECQKISHYEIIVR